MKTPTRVHGSEVGAAAVEFALISIVLFTILFAIVEFGLFFSRYQVFNGAAREGARVASTRGSQAAIVVRVLDASSPYEDDVPTGAITTTVDGAPASDPPCSDATRGEEVTVSWTQPFQDAIVLPFIPDVDINVAMKGVFRCE